MQTHAHTAPESDRTLFFILPRLWCLSCLMVSVISFLLHCDLVLVSLSPSPLFQTLPCLSALRAVSKSAVLSYVSGSLCLFLTVPLSFGPQLLSLSLTFMLVSLCLLVSLFLPSVSVTKHLSLAPIYPPVMFPPPSPSPRSYSVAKAILELMTLPPPSASSCTTTCSHCSVSKSGFLSLTVPVFHSPRSSLP